MRDYMKKAKRLTKDTMTKDTILKFNKAKVGFKDVENLAEAMMSKMKNSDKSRGLMYNIVKYLMKFRLNDAITSTKNARIELFKNKDDPTKVVRKGTFVRQEFMELVNEQLNQVWDEAKIKSNEKVNWNILK